VSYKSGQPEEDEEPPSTALQAVLKAAAKNRLMLKYQRI
jgi:hypothetical protein